jgi:hypothetical protein
MYYFLFSAHELQSYAKLILRIKLLPAFRKFSLSKIFFRVRFTLLF